MALIRQFLSRLFRRRPSGTLVGADEHGNRYYERIMPGYPTKRWMEPPGGSLNPSAYDTDKVPAPWRSWLAMQRREPPPPSPPIKNGPK